MKRLFFLILLLPVLTYGQSVSTQIKTDKIYSRIGRGISLYDTVFIKKGVALDSLENVQGLLGLGTPSGRVVYLPFQQFVDSIGGGYISGDTIVVGGDTLVATSYWSATGNDIENNNTGKVILPGDSTFFDAIPDEATKVGRILHVNQYGEIEWTSPIGLYNEMQDSLAEMSTPSPYGTWIRDTVNSRMYPVDTTDKVVIGKTTAHNFALVQINGDLDISTGKYYKIGAGRALSYNSSLANLFIGESGMSASLEGVNNTGCGKYSLYFNTVGESNSAYGMYSLYKNEDGYSNSAFGTNALKENVSGILNSAFGHDNSAQLTGNGNSAFGFDALYNSVDADSNVAFGTNALINNISGDNNTIIGTSAGYNTLGSDNVFMGHQAGYNETGSGKLYIDNSNADSTAALIFGNFTSNRVTINDNLDITDSLYVGGNAEFNEDIDVGGNINIAATTSTVGQFLHGKTRFLHTYTDDAAQPNIFFGEISGNFTTTGNYNAAFGNNTLSSNTTGEYSVAIGTNALNLNTTGARNMAIGANTLLRNTTGSDNVGIGYGALLGVAGQNFSGSVAIGSEAGFKLYGAGNVLIGYLAGYGGVSANGYSNTAVGLGALYAITSGYENVTIGRASLDANTSGRQNVAIGYSSLGANTSGHYNTAVGYEALSSNLTGTYNVALGYGAGKYITGSNKLVIDAGDKSNYANDTTQSLIFGNFTTNKLKVNGSFSSGVGTVADNDATPDVSGANTFIYAGSANSVAPTDLDNPTPGQYYTFIGNSDTYTLNFPGSTNFKMSGAGRDLGQYDNITFYCQADNLYIMVGYNDITP